MCIMSLHWGGREGGKGEVISKDECSHNQYSCTDTYISTFRRATLSNPSKRVSAFCGFSYKSNKL